MNDMGHLCRELLACPELTQRELSKRLGISLGKCNSLVRTALEKQYIHPGRDAYHITQAGLSYLSAYRVESAILIASDIDTRFVPFTGKQPKALMQAEGQRLIERLIDQLHQRGIRDITVVVGYLAERYEYLADKYNVSLVYNPHYATHSMLSALHLVRHRIHNSYLIQADQYLAENIFHEYEPESWLSCCEVEGETSRWCCTVDAKNRLRGLQLGGHNALVRKGPAYLARETMDVILGPMEELCAKPGASATPWEVLLRGLLDQIELYAARRPVTAVREFDSFADLRDFEINYAVHTGAYSLGSIARALQVDEDEICDMQWIETNAVNYVFTFTLRGEEYVCRVPGEDEGRFVTYKQEAAIYKALSGLGFTDVALDMNVQTGLKISRYYRLVPQYPQARFELLADNVALLRRLHQSGIKLRHHFNIADRLRQFDVLCRRAQCIRFEDYAETMAAVQRPLAIIQNSKMPRVLCHMNAISNDQIGAPDGSICFAHWEFSGMCHAVADVAMLGLCAGCDDEQMDTLLHWYLDRRPTREERQLYYSYLAVGGLLWSIWGEWRLHRGEDFLQYTMQMYRLCKRAVRRMDKGI